MAFLEQRNGWFRVVFKFRRKRYAHSLGTQDEQIANAIRGGIDRTLLQIQQRLVSIPDGTDIKEFILAGGNIPVVTSKITGANESVGFDTSNGSDCPSGLDFRSFQERYLAILGVGSVEDSTLGTVKMHLRHLQRSLGEHFPFRDLTHDDLQKHIVVRAKAKASHVTSIVTSLKRGVRSV